MLKSKFNIGDTVYGIHFEYDNKGNTKAQITKGKIVLVKSYGNFFEYYLNYFPYIFGEDKIASSIEELETLYTNNYEKLLETCTNENKQDNLKELENIRKEVLIAFDNYRKGKETTSDEITPRIPEITIKEQRLIAYQEFLSCEIKDTIKVLETFNKKVLNNLPYKPDYPHQFVSQIEALEQMKQEITTFRKEIENKNENWFMWKEFTESKE